MQGLLLGDNGVRTLDDIALSKKDRHAIQAAAAVVRQRFPIEQVVLFGSKARGEGDAHSDIDLLMLTQHPVGWRERDEINRVMFDLQLKLEVMLTTMIVSAQDWNEGVYQVMPIREEIDRDGAIV